jgi:sporulation protein YlmC with PRC-barrel domain
MQGVKWILAVVGMVMVSASSAVSMAQGPLPGPEDGGQILRSSQLIGMEVSSPDNRRLGTIEDMVVDMQGGSPTIFFVLAPAVGIPSDQLVIVPLDALQVRFDRARNTTVAIADLRMDQLRFAPHMIRNHYEVLRNRQFLTSARQFYRRVERSAARPVGENPAQPDQGPAPGKRPHGNPGQQPGIGPQPGPGTPRQPEGPRGFDGQRQPERQRQPEGRFRPGPALPGGQRQPGERVERGPR